MEQKRMEEIISFLASMCYNLYCIIDFGYLTFWDRVVWDGMTINEIIFSSVFYTSLGVVLILLYRIGTVKIPDGVGQFVQATFGLSDRALERQRNAVFSKLLGKLAQPVQNVIKLFGVNRAEGVMAVEQAQDELDPKLFFLAVQERLRLKRVMQFSDQDANSIDTELIPIKAIEIQEEDAKLGLLQKMKFWIIPIVCLIVSLIVTLLPNLRVI